MKYKCTKCREDRDESDFGQWKNSVGKMVRKNQCNFCKRKYEAKRYKENAKLRKQKAKNGREWRLQKEYGITQEEFDILRKEQNNKCDICREKFTEMPHVDHCHISDRVRGLLCRACNTGLGLFKDNIKRLKSAKRYLTKSNSLQYIYVDMDGVIANWHKSALRINGIIDTEEFLAKWPEGAEDISDVLKHRSREELLNACDLAHNFWRDLEKYHWADDLIDLCYSYTDNVFICTSPSKYSGCASQKVAWLQEYYPQLGNRRFVITKHKYLLADPTTVLIDDSHDQLKKFKKHGGNVITFPAQWNSARPFLDDPVAYVEKRLKEL